MWVPAQSEISETSEVVEQVPDIEFRFKNASRLFLPLDSSPAHYCTSHDHRQGRYSCISQAQLQFVPPLVYAQGEPIECYTNTIMFHGQVREGHAHGI